MYIKETIASGWQMRSLPVDPRESKIANTPFLGPPTLFPSAQESREAQARRGRAERGREKGDDTTPTSELCPGLVNNAARGNGAISAHLLLNATAACVGVAVRAQAELL